MPSLNAYAAEIHQTAVEHGFWEADRNFGEMIALMHSELSEALEEHRAGNPVEYYQINGKRVYRVTDGSGADWTTNPGGLTEVAQSTGEGTWTNVTAKPEGAAVELADCIIRCLDAMHSLGVDIDAVVTRKMIYNATRPHKHGKAY